MCDILTTAETWLKHLELEPGGRPNTSLIARIRYSRGMRMTTLKLQKHSSPAGNSIIAPKSKKQDTAWIKIAWTAVQIPKREDIGLPAAGIDKSRQDSAVDLGMTAGGGFRNDFKCRRLNPFSVFRPTCAIYGGSPEMAEWWWERLTRIMGHVEPRCVREQQETCTKKRGIVSTAHSPGGRGQRVVPACPLVEAKRPVTECR